jgi:glycosyltransferase involved in cell wall biosynthesis
MKVVFVHPSYPNQFTRVAARLAADYGWDCACLVRDEFASSVKRDAPEIAYYGYREESSRLSGNYYSQTLEEGARCGKAVAEALAHIKKTAGLDVVVGHASFGTTFFARQLLRIPVISYVELPGYFPVFAREEFPAGEPQVLLDVALRALIFASVMQSDLCLVPSRHAKRLFPPDVQGKVRVQTEGFSLPALIQDRRALRRRLGFDEKAPLIGFAGRTLEAVRGFDVFCRIAKKILARRGDARFLIIGSEETIYGNETSYLNGKSFKQFCFEQHQLDDQPFRCEPFLPYDEFIQYLQALDVILFPLFEGAANWSLFEAMAAGVPLLASNRCFIPEAVTHGRDGLLFDVNDIDGFCRATLSLIDNPAKGGRLAANARKTIGRRFSVDRATHGYRAIIEEALAKANGWHGTDATNQLKFG